MDGLHGLQLFHFRIRQPAPLSAGKIPQGDRAEFNPLQADHLMPDRLHHFSDLPVPALVD